MNRTQSTGVDRKWLTGGSVDKGEIRANGLLKWAIQESVQGSSHRRRERLSYS